MQPPSLIILLTFLCATIGISPLVAQTPLIDSLQNEFAQATGDTSQIDLINLIGFEFRHVNLDSSTYYADKALSRSRSIAYDAGVARALNTKALAIGIKGDEFKAKVLNEKALNYAHKTDDTEVTAGILNDLAFYYTTIGDFDQAIALTIEAEDIHKEGLVHINSLFNLSITYNMVNDTAQADYYLTKAIQVCEEVAEPTAKVMAFQLKARAFANQAKMDSAIIMAQKGVELAAMSQNIDNEGSATITLGRMYARAGKREVALQHFLRGTELTIKAGHFRNLVYQYQGIARIYLSLDQVEEAREYALLGYNLSLEQKDVASQQNYLFSLAQIEEKAGDDSKAYAYFKDANQIKESIFTEQQQQLSAEMTAKYKLKEQEAENLNLQAKQRHTQRVLEGQNLTMAIVLVILVFMSLLAVIALWSNQQKQRHSRLLEEQVESKTQELRQMVEKLEDSNAELERFNYITSHDLKEPIRNITSFSTLIERKALALEDQELKDYSSFVGRSARHLYQFVEDILEYTRISYQDQAQFAMLNLKEEIFRIQDLLKNSEKEQNGEIKFENLPIIYTDQIKVPIILKNLIENGLKYNESDLPLVHIAYLETDTHHQLIVEDNGIGISTEFHEKIFVMFKRLHNRTQYEGSGIGLAISQKLAQKLDGHIEVESLDQGSRFSFLFAKQDVQA